MNRYIYIVGLLNNSMGDRFYLDLKCAYCGTNNEGTYYAPTCGFNRFKCCKCMSPNFIKADFSIVKDEDVTQEMIQEGKDKHSNGDALKMVMEEIDNAKM